MRGWTELAARPQQGHPLRPGAAPHDIRVQSDRSGFRHAAEVLTGEPVPEDEPLSVTRAKAGM